MMKFVGVSELKAKLSEYISLVKAGETLTVTARGKPVARIIPVQGITDDTRRADLVSRGLLRPGKGRISQELLDRLPVTRLGDDDVRRVVEEDRKETL